MLTGLQTLCRDYKLSGDQIFKLAQKLYESKIFSAKISAIMIICRLCKRIYRILTKDISHNRISDILAITQNAARSRQPQVRCALAKNLKYLLREIPTL